MADQMIPRQRVPFRGYIFRLLENNGIPNPPGGQTKEELWGYFIEEMSKKGGSNIISALPNGSVVSELTASILGDTVTVSRTMTDLNTSTSSTQTLDITAGTNVVLSGSIATGITISVPSIGKTTKFTSTESASGVVGSTGTWSIAATTPFVTGDTLDVGSIVYMANNFTVEVDSVDTVLGTFDGVVIEVSQHVQADWNETNTASGSYILNKPDVATIEQDLLDVTTLVNDIVTQFGDGYFVKELVANVDTTTKSIEIVKTHTNIDPTQPTNTYILTMVAGSAMTMVSSVDSNGDPVVTIDVDLTSPTSPITNILNDITTIFGDITTIQGDITTIQGDITTIQGDITTINTNITNIDNRVTTVEGDITTIKTDITNIKGDITTIKTDITNLQTDVSNKVDKVAGKGLSTEDYTTAEKTKLAGIETGAQVNVQSDWNETNTLSDAYILNKPTISSNVTYWQTVNVPVGIVVGSVVNDDVTDLAKIVGPATTPVIQDIIIGVDSSGNSYKSLISSISGTTITSTVYEIQSSNTIWGSITGSILNQAEFAKLVDGYLVKSAVTTVNDTAGTIETVITNTSLVTSSTTNVDKLTVIVGDGLMLTSGTDSGGDPTVTVEMDLTSPTSPITNILNDITTIQGDIVTIQGDITTIQGDITTINSTLTTHATNISNLQTSVTNINTSITNIQNDISTLQTDVSNIDSRVTTVEGDIVTIQTDITNIKTDITTIQGDITNIKTDITNLKSAYIPNRMKFVGNGTSNTITLPSTINSSGADVFINGLLLDSSEYTLSNTVFDYTANLWTLDASDDIIIKWYTAV